MGPSRRFSNSSAEGSSATPVGPDRMALREVPLHGNRKRILEGRADVVVDGKKYEPTALGAKTGIINTRRYKARFVQDEHRTSYDSFQEYEFLFPDKKTRKLLVPGQTE